MESYPMEEQSDVVSIVGFLLHFVHQYEIDEEKHRELQVIIYVLKVEMICLHYLYYFIIHDNLYDLYFLQ